MKIIDRPSVNLVNPVKYTDVLDTFNIAARNCYQSLNEKTDNIESAERLARNIIKSGHLAMVEFGSATFKIKTDRAVLAQITRSRLMTFAVQSQRYVDYNKSGEIEFMVPYDLYYTDDAYPAWESTCKACEEAYKEMRELGKKPEVARSVLPNSTVTTIVASANFREWRHFIELRCDSHAQADIRYIAELILIALYTSYPVFFEDLYKKFIEKQETEK